MRRMKREVFRIKRMNTERLPLFKETGKEFSGEIIPFPEIIETGIVGSTAGDSNYPGDLDIYIILENFNHIPQIAKLDRKIWGQKHISPDIFFFDREFKDLGQLCHRKEWPKGEVGCVTECRRNTRFVHLKAGFVFDKKEFLSSPLIELYSPEKIFLKKRGKYDVKEVKKYEKSKDIELYCFECREYFVFSIAEQEFYENNGLSLPKKCEDCRERRKGWILNDDETMPNL